MYVVLHAIGPVRVVTNAYTYHMRQYRARKFHHGEKGIKKMVEDDLKGMTSTEFLNLSVEVR